MERKEKSIVEGSDIEDHKDQHDFGWDSLSIEEQADFAGIHEETKWALKEEEEEIMKEYGVEKYEQLPEHAKQEIFSKEMDWSSMYGGNGAYVNGMIAKKLDVAMQDLKKDETGHKNREPDIETLRSWDAEEKQVADEVRAQEWLNEMRGYNARLPDFDDLNYTGPDIADQFDDIDDD